MPEGVREIAQQQLRDPVNIEIQQRAAAAETIRQRYVVAAPDQKEAALLRLLEAETYDAAIIFVKLRGTTEPLAQLLSQHGHRAAALNGEMAQAQRERIIEQLKSGQISIVVATDVAARGLDVRRVSHVINYDLPRDREAYVHRIGRTGRAGRSGEAILFMHPRRPTTPAKSRTSHATNHRTDAAPQQPSHQQAEGHPVPRTHSGGTRRPPVRSARFHPPAIP
ncbi:MAG UNVERIFIED_CONTAM: DEAD/DEAH box helicase [Planctomycetaceae bacterium]